MALILPLSVSLCLSSQINCLILFLFVLHSTSICNVIEFVCNSTEKKQLSLPFLFKSRHILLHNVDSLPPQLCALCLNLEKAIKKNSCVKTEGRGKNLTNSSQIDCQYRTIGRAFHNTTSGCTLQSHSSIMSGAQ
jgi:hypothetical protein